MLILLYFQLCFVARKKFSHLSFLHVFHHGTVAMSTYPGVRWLPGGHSTFWGLLNSLVHVFMYSYYFMAALGPEYSKYVWWKTHITKMQMIQFVLIFIHEFQLFYKNDCDYPMGLAYFIAAQSVLFFILFANFYLKSRMYQIKNQNDIRYNHISMCNRHLLIL